jgi:hypothetical protein
MLNPTSGHWTGGHHREAGCRHRRSCLQAGRFDLLKAIAPPQRPSPVDTRRVVPRHDDHVTPSAPVERRAISDHPKRCTRTPRRPPYDDHAELGGRRASVAARRLRQGARRRPGATRRTRRHSPSAPARGWTWVSIPFRWAGLDQRQVQRAGGSGSPRATVTQDRAVDHTWLPADGCRIRVDAPAGCR